MTLTEIKLSPRMENGVIKWFEGDRFGIDFEIIDDETGEPYTLKDGETVEITFHKQGVVQSFSGGNIPVNRAVKTFEFDHTADCAALSCKFDEETTKLFPAGRYTYCIKLNGTESRLTVSANNVAEVERCH